MTTSRVKRFAKRDWFCNVQDGEHYVPSAGDVWVCSKCYEEAEQSDEQERLELLDRIFVLCNNCKEAGKIETTCYGYVLGELSVLFPADSMGTSGHEPLIMCSPFDYAELDLGEILRKEWEEDVADFGIWTIQNEHGNICPQKSHVLWADDDWPPLTRIGRTLSAQMDLIDHTMIQAAGNLTLAKLRLEEICEAETLGTTEPVKDRLPSKIVSLFNIGIQGVKGQTEDIAALGMSAIKLATEEPHGISFVQLQRALHASNVRTGLGSLNVQKVLHAAKGYLNVTWLEDGQYMKAYHIDFFLYASERYNEDLESFKL